MSRDVDEMQAAAAECGMEHVSTLVADELARIRELDAENSDDDDDEA